MAEQRLQTESLLEEARPAIEGIIRKQLRVTLSPADGSHDNQNALQLFGDVHIYLLEQLERARNGSDQDQIKDFRGYAAVVTYHACAEYKRREYPEWTRLKNKLRYFLRHQSDYALWERDEKESLCGFSTWKPGLRLSTPNELLRELCENPQIIATEIMPIKTVDLMEIADWKRLLNAIFDRIGCPIDLDDLVQIAADLLGIKEDKKETEANSDREDEGEKEFERIPSPEADALSISLLREFLRQLWQEICQLGPSHRIAYLLNFRDADGDIQLFTWHGIATIEEIGRRLALSDQQFERAWQELPMDEEIRLQARLLASSAPEERFALLWLYLPIEDIVIAKMLGTERQKVINLRLKARERLARRLKHLNSGGYAKT